VGFLTGAPGSGRYVRGCVSFEKDAAVGSPIGYVTTVTGSPGTQVALPALDDAATSTTRQTTADWVGDSITSPTAAKTRVRGSRVTTSTSSTSGGQVLVGIDLNDNTTTVIDAVITCKLPSSTSGASCKVSGSFTRNSSTVTRLGSDDIGT